MNTNRIAIFASGSGTNAERIIQYFQDHPGIRVTALLSNTPKAYALKRCAKYDVSMYVFTRYEFFESNIVLQWLVDHRISHIVLAGFLWLIPGNLLDTFPQRIINIHPALLPKYGGAGMYGDRVHEAVIRSGDQVSGITIHEVNDRFDEGRILFQERCVVEKDDVPATLAARIHELEYRFYPPVIERWINGAFSNV